MHHLRNQTVAHKWINRGFMMLGTTHTHIMTRITPPTHTAHSALLEVRSSRFPSPLYINTRASQMRALPAPALARAPTRYFSELLKYSGLFSHSASETRWITALVHVQVIQMNAYDIAYMWGTGTSHMMVENYPCAMNINPCTAIGILNGHS